MTITQATRALVAVAPAPRAERVPLSEALGRTLCEDLAARANHPAADVSAMDGYACRAQDTKDASSQRPRRLRVVGEAATAAPFEGEVGSGEAVAISTGARLPLGSDAVVLLEEVESDGSAVLLSRPATARHVRRSGEDLRLSRVYLEAGEVLGPIEVAVAAALGHGELPVARPPRVAVIATGPELVPPGQPAGLDNVYASNGPLVAALLGSFGALTLLHPVIGDSAEELEGALSAVSDADLIVTTGGASIGRHDLVRKVLLSDGDALFERIAVRPGGPAMLVRWRDRTVLALPGTPVAAALLGTVLLQAWCTSALGKSAGPSLLRPRHAVSTTPLRGVSDKTCLWLAAIADDEQGVTRARLVEPQGSASFSALLQANAIIVLPPGGGAQAGEPVKFVPLPRSGQGSLPDQWPA